jgi:NADH:ubiquinone oxidoreductase subunit K
MTADLEASWKAEGLLVAWLSLSFVLMSVALAFRHFARQKEATFNRVFSKVVSSTAALGAAGVSAVALLVYRSRSAQVPHERLPLLAFSCVGSALSLAQLAVATEIFLFSSAPRSPFLVKQHGTEAEDLAIEDLTIEKATATFL